MKMIKLIIMSFLVVNISYAYDSTIRDRNGKVIGYIDSGKGTITVHDKYGKKKSTIKDGVVKDKYGKIQGYIKDDR